MHAVKKINNNVAVCMDDNGKELVAFGKGIGFPSMPYEIRDLAKLDRTFYNINPHYISMLHDIPSEIIELTAQIVDVAQHRLDYNLNPNLVLTLADHIAFAMERKKKNIHVYMPLIYDIEQIYTDEIQIAQFALQKIKDTFHVQLSPQEASGIALNIVNAKLEEKPQSKVSDSTIQQNTAEQILQDMTKIVEKEMQIQVNRESFNYARYATHVMYLLQRIHEHKHVSSENLLMYKSLKEEAAEACHCVNQIDKYFEKKLHTPLSEEEKLYLILHINRLCAKE